MKNINDVESAISSYEKAVVDALPNSGPAIETTNAEARLREILLARDEIVRALAAEPKISSDDLNRITQTDRKLKQDFKKILPLVPSTTFQDWREVIQPPETHWWWYLDARDKTPKPIPTWAVLAVIFTIITISLIFDTTSRILGGQLDFIKVFGTLVQVAVALAGAGALTELGRKWMLNFVARTGFRVESVNAWRTLFALGALTLALLMWFILPPIAALFYNNRGNVLHQAGLSAKAAESYQRAIALNPEYVDVHYNLALAYEDMGDYDKALEGYQRAISLDRKYYRAYNNLARLYILRKKDYASALNYLKTELDLNPEPQAVRYTLHKNRGWANWGLQDYDQAEQSLREAIQLAGDPRQTRQGVAAHCLLAQVLKARSVSGPELLSECEACVAFAADPDSRDIIEATWLNFAQQCMREGK
ncbi:MAG TPA: tetratricopeptide repeat protein [Pyrinomonadaceae bacterium]|nr:tetratricopeptide repeat protein [Pyrinomonadaceae bacterium]